MGDNAPKNLRLSNNPDTGRGYLSSSCWSGVAKRPSDNRDSLTVALGCPAELEGKTPSLKTTHSLVQKPSRHQTHLISKCKGTNSKALGQQIMKN